MPTKIQKFTSENGIKFAIPFENAQLFEFKSGWRIRFKAINPITNLLEPSEMKFQRERRRIGDDMKARKYAISVCEKIDRKLASGWNPWTEFALDKKKSSFKSATDLFLKEKEKEQRKDGYRTYKSQIKMLIDWLTSKNISALRCCDWNENIAVDYFDYVYITKGVGGRTFNNYRAFMTILFNWLIEKKYVDENPFKNSQKKRVKKTKRDLIDPEHDEAILNYCRNNDPYMELVIYLVLNSFMRPAEICRATISDIDWNINAILLDSDQTKNAESRYALLSPVTIQFMKDHGFSELPGEWHFCSKGKGKFAPIQPGEKQINTRDVDRNWAKLRTDLGLPKGYQLYGFRNTGVTEMKQRGLKNEELSKISGHINPEQLNTYTAEPDEQTILKMVTLSPVLGKRKKR